jgi:protein-tyrosine phosphatase
LAAKVDPEDIISDYMETVRRGELRASHGSRQNDEPELNEFCRSHGTTTEQAFRDALASVEIDTLLAKAGLPLPKRRLLATWRGALGSSDLRRSRLDGDASRTTPSPK